MTEAAFQLPIDFSFVEKNNSQYSADRRLLKFEIFNF